MNPSFYKLQWRDGIAIGTTYMIKANKNQLNQSQIDFGFTVQRHFTDSWDTVEQQKHEFTIIKTISNQLHISPYKHEWLNGIWVLREVSYLLFIYILFFPPNILLLEYDCILHDIYTNEGKGRILPWLRCGTQWRNRSQELVSALNISSFLYIAQNQVPKESNQVTRRLQCE